MDGALPSGFGRILYAMSAPTTKQLGYIHALSRQLTGGPFRGSRPPKTFYEASGLIDKLRLAQARKAARLP